MLRGARHGLGTFTFNNGDMYDGSYAHGNREGEGSFTWRRGESVAKYVGQWLANEMHGRGTLSYPDGSRHVDGEWARGQRVGQSGEFIFRTGHTYQGNWAHSTFQDGGCFTYAEGDRYEGQWSGGERHGGGTYTHSEGDVYTGAWLKDQREGGCHMLTRTSHTNRCVRPGPSDRVRG